MNYNLPPSTYWIGDIKHVMTNTIFNNWKNNNYDEGIYDDNNKKYLVIPAVCGDNYYEGSDGFIYQVISGHLGLIDVRLCTNISITQMIKGRIQNFLNPINVQFKYGVIKITSNNFKLTIDTNEEDEDENEEYDDDPDYIPNEESESESESESDCELDSI
jgi:hypothetical protein